MKNLKAGLSRRNFLEIAGLAGGVVALSRGSFISPALAATPGTPPLLLFVYFNGGWDQMLTLDPRDNMLAQFRAPGAYQGPNATNTEPAYDRVNDADIQAVVTSTSGKGIQSAGALTFGPAIPPAFLDHSPDLAIVRGMNMQTLTHEVGRRYFLTGKFPRGLSASGSSLSTVVAASGNGAQAVPNLSVSTEAYNEGLPAFASAISAPSAADLQRVFTPDSPLAGTTDQVLVGFETTDDSCVQRAADGQGLVSLFRQSRTKARTLVNPTAAQLFNFSLAAPSPSVATLFGAFGISTSKDLSGPKASAALAAQALTTGTSQAVSVQLSQDLDDHFDWAASHGTTLKDSFAALDLLIRYLKASPMPGLPSDSVWKHTTMVVFSEFARTPNLNGRAGRDHHLTSSCLLAGPGIKGNQVIGATTLIDMTFQNVNVTTGQVDALHGVTVRPADVHATVLQSMGLSYAQLSNQSPNIVTALLK